MRILFVDDDVCRHTKFQSLHPDYDIWWAENPYQAIEEMKLREYDLIYLDHDMGEGYPDGSYLVKQIIEKKLAPNAHFYVHSMNPIAGKRMAQNLIQDGRSVKWLPGAWMR